MVFKVSNLDGENLSSSSVLDNWPGIAEKKLDLTNSQNIPLTLEARGSVPWLRIQILHEAFHREAIDSNIRLVDQLP